MADNPNEPNEQATVSQDTAPVDEQATAHQDTAPADGPGSAPDQATVESDGTGSKHKKGKKPKPDPADSRDVGDRDWHSAFTAACQLVWDPIKYNLRFVPEHVETLDSIKTDILIEKKDPASVIGTFRTDPIGFSFRQYNIIQFKSETDSFGLIDLYQEFVYAYSFLHGNPGVDYKDILITVFCPPGITAVRKLAGECSVPVAEDQFGIITIDFKPVPVRIVPLGSIGLSDSNLCIRYAPLNMFTENLDLRRINNLLWFRYYNISTTNKNDPPNQWYNALVNCISDHKPHWKDPLRNVRKVLKDMSDTDFVNATCPNFIQETEKNCWVGFMKVMIDEHRLNLDEAADSPSRPKFLTRDQAIDLLIKKPPETADNPGMVRPAIP